jgi:parallel beta-helix repeat protein
MRIASAALCALLATTALRAAAEPAPLRPRSDDVLVRSDARLADGVWRIQDVNGNGVLRIETDGVTLDLGRAALVGAAEGVAPDGYAGVGIVVAGARGVTIRGGRIRGFKVAIRADDAPGLVIERVDASENHRQHLGSTPAREDPADWLRPHDNDRDEWATRYGAAFSLTSCPGASVRNCQANEGQNGLLLTRSDGCEVHENDFSFNSGWGIALYRSSKNKITGNRCDWCVRGYSHGVYHRGQDSAGILLFEQCSGNLVVGNSATHGGDGFFLYAGEDTTRRTGTGGCNRNLVFDNDFAYAVANGIEATFSEENVFVRNDCSGCDHGVWAGYSRHTLIGGNRIDGCLTAGVSIEHGQDNRIVANRISGAPVGIHLWWDADPPFVDGVFGKQGDTASRRNTIEANDIQTCGTAVRLVTDSETQVRWNLLHAHEILLDLGPKTRPGLVAHNLLRGARTADGPVPLAVRNASDIGWTVPSTNRRRGHLRGTPTFDPLTLPEAMGVVRPPTRLPDTPPAPGRTSARRPAHMPRGRAHIRVGAWGPLDPRIAHVFPRRQVAAGPEALLHLTGSGTYELVRKSGAVTVEPARGALPGTVRVGLAPAAKPQPSLASFEVAFNAGGAELVATGVLLRAAWRVSHFQWTRDPREDDAAFRALLEGPPVTTRQVPALDERWRVDGPDGVARNRFATLATTLLELPAGRYRVRTVSDDGVRVRIGGRLVIDNWTHHAPTEDTAEIDLPAGRHEVRVEHFEIDGWAQLGFRIEPAQ